MQSPSSTDVECARRRHFIVRPRTSQGLAAEQYLDFARSESAKAYLCFALLRPLLCLVDSTHHFLSLDNRRQRLARRNGAC